jgi:hypothetical protein
MTQIITAANQAAIWAAKVIIMTCRPFLYCRLQGRSCAFLASAKIGRFVALNEMKVGVRCAKRDSDRSQMPRRPTSAWPATGLG